MTGEKGFSGRGNSAHRALNGNRKLKSWPMGLSMVNKGKKCKRPYYNFTG